MKFGVKCKFQQVLQSLTGLPNLQGVAHRDLKPENFLLKRKALDARTPLRAEDLRLVDFGLAVLMEPGKELTELLGSPFYVAPELLQVCSCLVFGMRGGGWDVRVKLSG